MLEGLLAVRKARGLTQQQLSDASHVNRVNIHKYERCKTDPTTEIALKLARALGVTVDEIIKEHTHDT